MSFCDAIRESAARVADHARYLRIEPDALEGLAASLAREKPGTPDYDVRHHHRGSEASTLAFNVTLDSINFGSGWWPLLRKRPGLSGYFTVATSLKERFDAGGPMCAAELGRLDAAALTALLGQEGTGPEIATLMEHFARALRDLGAWLERRFGGRFEGPVEEAGGSAERLAELLAEMPLYRDVHRYEEFDVPLYKRAQIVPADLALAFGDRGAGRFRDLDRLTIFSDNLVPHVLRRLGVLVYDPGLAERIERGELLAAGSKEEIEIRAVAVHAVERLVAAVRQRGGATSARELDQLLWTRGQSPGMKAHPRHRTRSVYY